MVEVVCNLAGVISQEQADDAALIHLHQALVLKPDFVLAQVLLGEILQKQERSADAIAAYRAVPEDSALSWIVRLRIADAVQVMGQTEQARAAFDRLAAPPPAGRKVVV